VLRYFRHGIRVPERFDAARVADFEELALMLRVRAAVLARVLPHPKRRRATLWWNLADEVAAYATSRKALDVAFAVAKAFDLAEPTIQIGPVTEKPADPCETPLWWSVVLQEALAAAQRALAGRRCPRFSEAAQALAVRHHSPVQPTAEWHERQPHRHDACAVAASCRFLWLSRSVRVLALPSKPTDDPVDPAVEARKAACCDAAVCRAVANLYRNQFWASTWHVVVEPSGVYGEEGAGWVVTPRFFALVRDSAPNTVESGLPYEWFADEGEASEKNLENVLKALYTYAHSPRPASARCAQPLIRCPRKFR
jgi:hypothetical protein